MRPTRLEVVAPVLTDFKHCAHCEALFRETAVGPRVHREILQQYPQELKEDYERLSAWLIDLAHRYGAALQIRLVDPQSAEGFWKCMRYWIRRYPAFVLAGRKVHEGWDKDTLDRIVRKSLGGDPSASKCAESVLQNDT